MKRIIAAIIAIGILIPILTASAAAQITSPDIMADNGVIQAINAIVQRPWPLTGTIETLPAAGEGPPGIPDLE